MNFKITVKISEAIKAMINIALIRATTSPDKKIIFCLFESNIDKVNMM